MRIISKFQDVYDLQHSMFDAERVWNRKTETIAVRDTFEFDLVPRLHTNRFIVEAVPYFLAGEVHFLFKLSDINFGSFSTFKLNELKEILVKLGVVSFRTREILYTEDLNKALAQWVSILEELNPKLVKILGELRVPLCTIKMWEERVPDNKSTQVVPFYDVLVNPKLMDSVPWQHIEPNLYRLHQTLEQYIFGVLGTGEPDLITTSDKDRLEAHGFSAVSSFRSMKREE